MATNTSEVSDGPQGGHNERTRGRQIHGREDLATWQATLCEPVLRTGDDFEHSLHFLVDSGALSSAALPALRVLAAQISSKLEPLVAENDRREHLPSLSQFDGIGQRRQLVEHHPAYYDAGDIIYASGMMRDLAEGKIVAALASFFLTSHAGEAGHNCPVACTAGVLRILQQVAQAHDFPQHQAWIDKLVTPSFRENFTGAQFVTEVQGGSDVGQNDTLAVTDDAGNWRIFGEKWFCSNANADLILLTARTADSHEGTSGVGLFLIPAVLDSGAQNYYTIRRLKEKLGTRTMASGEIDFDGALAYPIADPAEAKIGFKLLMENVLHLSRIFNSFAATGAAHRAYQVARSYAAHRRAFGVTIENYPLVQQNLVQIHSENSALIASALHTAALQQQADTTPSAANGLLQRTRANVNKFMTAKFSVEHVHHCIDVLAGNGTIETFSPLPRLLRDAVVYENWEGTHNTLFMQLLRDILKYDVDKLFLDEVQQYFDPCRNLIDGELVQRVDTLSTCCREQALQLRNSNAAMQTLRVAQWTQNAGWLDALVALTVEGVHQQQHDACSTKLDLALWLSQHRLPLDEAANEDPEQLKKLL